jgi:hypothetical protein
MKSFLEFIDEDKINYNHTNQHWQVRDDKDQHFKYERPHVIIKQAQPHVDHDAHEAGKRVHVFMKGDKADHVPTGHHKREIKFNRGNLDHPFIHADDSSPVHHADYVEFHHNKVYAHYKKT